MPHSETNIIVAAINLVFIQVPPVCLRLTRHQISICEWNHISM